MAGDGRADEPCILCYEKGVPLLSQRMRMRWAVFFRFVMGSAPGCERIYNPERVSVCASLCVCVVCCCLLCVCVDYIFAQNSSTRLACSSLLVLPLHVGDRPLVRLLRLQPCRRLRLEELLLVAIRSINTVPSIARR